MFIYIFLAEMFKKQNKSSIVIHHSLIYGFVLQYITHHIKGSVLHHITHYSKALHCNASDTIVSLNHSELHYIIDH